MIDTFTIKPIYQHQATYRKKNVWFRFQSWRKLYQWKI